MALTMQWLAATVVATLALSAGLASVAPVELPDQRGGHDRLEAHLGKPVVVVVVDARRLATAGKWAEELVQRFPGLALLTIADVNESRPTTLARVSEVLSRRVPARAVVLIDMDRAWAHALSLDTAAPNVLVVDAAGGLAAQVRGRWSEPLAAEVAGTLVALGVAGAAP
jgi:hypothetical protein